MAKTLTLRVVKAISLLGSTQGLNMLCSVLRMKALSLLVGPAGVGLMGALTQTSDFISNVTQLNIRTTAVPQMASAPPAQFSAILVCVRRYGRLLGCIGMALMFLFAPLLSEFTFGTDGYAWAYRIASAAMLFQSLQGTELVVLQATSRYKPIAASGLFTAVTGLLIAVPLYWGLRIDGIAPSIVGYAVVAWIGAMWFTRRHRVAGPRPSWGDSLRLGRGFIIVGAMLTLTSLTADGVNFLFMAIVSRSGDDALGLFQAGHTIVWRYTAIFFTAFAMEFYPRLSKSVKSARHTRLLITHQAIISTLMMVPCTAAIILLAPWVISILYSSEFLGVTPYVIWGMVGMALRPLSITMSYSFLAAGRGKVYCLTEILSSLCGFACNVAGYKLLGFTGLGIALAVWMTIELAIILLTARCAGAPLPKPRAIILSLALTALLVPLALIMCP